MKNILLLIVFISQNFGQNIIQDFGFDPFKSKSKTNYSLNDISNYPIGIFSINDPSALGAYAAVEKSGRLWKIRIVGFDASPSGKQAVYEEKIYDSPQHFPRKMAVGTMEAFIAYSEGKSVPKNKFIECKHYYYSDSIKDSSRVKEQWWDPPSDCI